MPKHIRASFAQRIEAQRPTRRARRIWPLHALEKLENRQGFHRFPACAANRSIARTSNEMIGF